MAHAAHLQQSVEKIVRSILHVNQDHATIQVAKEASFRRLKQNSHARTNPFEIDAQLDGLIEKFSIKDRDDLADCLRSCLDQLPTRKEWVPDMLSLLLELSDRPVEKVKPEDLSTARYRELKAPALTWYDILAQDPIEHDHDIWDDVERGYHSSGDDRTEADDPASDFTTSSAATSISDHDAVSLARLHVLVPDLSLLDAVKQAQARLRSSHESLETSFCSELAFTRETVNMLNGLPTSIYTYDTTSGQVDVAGHCRLATVNYSTVQHFASQCASLGTEIGRLRVWSRKKQMTGIVQAMQTAVGHEFLRMDSMFNAIARRYLHTRSPLNVSMLDVKAEIDDAAGRVLAVSRSICDQVHCHHLTGLKLLDCLYDSLSLAQLSADTVAFDALCSVFLRGFNSYLPMLQHWLSTGYPDKEDTHESLIKVNDANCPLGRMWSDRFALRVSDNGEPLAPKIVQRFVDRIYSIGKSKALLNQLQRKEPDQTKPAGIALFDDMTVIQNRLRQEPLLPISHLLEEALEEWVRATGSGTDASLKETLRTESSLWQTLSAIDHVFFGRDNSKLQSFAESVLNGHRTFLRNAFMLTEVLQATVGSHPDVDTSRLTLRLEEESSGIEGNVEILRHITLEFRLPWLFQNIARSEHLEVHSSIFTLLLQTQIAKLRLQSMSSKGQASVQMQVILQLRHKLLWITDVLLSHITSTSSMLHGNLTKDMGAADGIDDLARIWSDYERKLELNLLLTRRCKPVKDAILGILELSERFIGLTGTGWESDTTRLTRHGVNKNIIEKSRSLSRLSEEVERSLSFIQAGIRGISRAAGQPALELLSTKLERWNQC